MNITIEIID